MNTTTLQDEVTATFADAAKKVAAGAGPDVDMSNVSTTVSEVATKVTSGADWKGIAVKVGIVAVVVGVAGGAYLLYRRYTKKTEEEADESISASMDKAMDEAVLKTVAREAREKLLNELVASKALTPEQAAEVRKTIPASEL